MDAAIIKNTVNHTKRQKRPSLLRSISEHKFLYLLILPGLIYYIIYRYIPMFGLLIAFKDYSPAMGISGFFTAEWIGLRNLKLLFDSIYFVDILKNTLIISFLKLAASFPVAILLAIMINEVRNKYLKKFIQTVTYYPHFLSWVVIGAVMFEMFSTTTGAVNNMLQQLIGHKVDILANPENFRALLVMSHLWQSAGWSAIIYLAAITGIDESIYESAMIDGATRIQRILFITIPSIIPTIVVVLTLSLGHVLDAGFEQVFVLYSPKVYEVGDIIDTYVYREGLVNARYGFATAIGFFKSLIGFVLVFSTDRLAKKLGNSGIF